MSEEFRPVAPVDPTNLRPMLFLDVAREIMLSPDWSHRAVTVVMESHTGPGRFSFYGANHPDTIDAVHERRVDISTVNPAAMLTMAYRGAGVYGACGANHFASCVSGGEIVRMWGFSAFIRWGRQACEQTKVPRPLTPCIKS